MAIISDFVTDIAKSFPLFRWRRHPTKDEIEHPLNRNERPFLKWISRGKMRRFLMNWLSKKKSFEANFTSKKVLSKRYFLHVDRNPEEEVWNIPTKPFTSARSSKKDNAVRDCLVDNQLPLYIASLTSQIVSRSPKLDLHKIRLIMIKHLLQETQASFNHASSLGRFFSTSPRLVNCVTAIES